MTIPTIPVKVSGAYDVPAMIAEVAKLMDSAAGQEILARLLGEHGIDLEELRSIWQQDEKVDDGRP